MSAAPFSSPLLDEARRHAELAISGIGALHLGPLDYNIATTRDDLLVALRLLEQFGQEQSKR